MLSLSLPTSALSEEWFPLETGMRWSYRVSGLQKHAIEGMEQTSRVYGQRSVEVGDVSAELPQSPYEVISTESTQNEGQPGTQSMTSRGWVRAGKEGVLNFAQEFANPLMGGPPRRVRYSPPLQYLPADPSPGQSWHIGVERVMGMAVDLTGTVVGIRDVETAAGVHRGCLAVTYRGSVSGQLETPQGPMPIEGGSYTSTSYYAPGLGAVLENVRYKTRLRIPGGPLVVSEVQTEYSLESSSLLPVSPASSDSR